MLAPNYYVNLVEKHFPVLDRIAIGNGQLNHRVIQLICYCNFNVHFICHGIMLNLLLLRQKIDVDKIFRKSNFILLAA